MHEPSEINDQLTDDRIDAVGRLLVEAHNGVIEREEPFDNGWSIGTRSHTWRMGRIVQAVERSELPWLSLIDGSLKFIFAIGDTPVNMFRHACEYVSWDHRKAEEKYSFSRGLLS